MLNLTPSPREQELRQAIDQIVVDLEERAEIFRGGYTPESADVVADNLVVLRLEIHRQELEAEIERRRVWLVMGTAWGACTILMIVAFLSGAPQVAMGLFTVIMFVQLWEIQRKLPPLEKSGGSGGYVAPFIRPDITPSLAYRTAGENDKFTAAVLRLAYGKEYVDGLLKDLEELEDVEPTTTVQAIVFRPGEHTGLENQELHETAARTLDLRVRNMDPEHLSIAFSILYGDAGRGKTTLVKVATQAIRDRLQEFGVPQGQFVEAFGGDLNRAKKLDAKIRLANSIPGSVLFIDEIHAIPPEIAERLYLLTDRDHRYQFEGDSHPTVLNPFTLFGATTDLGKLHPAFRSRADLLPLELVSPEKLMSVALGMPYSVAPEAAELIVERVKWDGMPRSVVSLLEFSREFAKAAGREEVLVEDVYEAIEVRRIDEWGLGPFHRDVVRVLARTATVVGHGTRAERTVYKLSEASLLAMAKVDALTYREDLRPNLMDRGFLIATSGGQQLTDAGLAYAQTRRGS